MREVREYRMCRGEKMSEKTDAIGLVMKYTMCWDIMKSSLEDLKEEFPKECKFVMNLMDTVENSWDEILENKRKEKNQ